MIQSCSNEVVYSHVPHPGMDTPCRVFIIASLVLISTAFTACRARGDKGTMHAKGAHASAAATPMQLTSGGIAPIILFNGTGTSSSDVAAVEAILNSNHLNYSTVNSSQLNEATRTDSEVIQTILYRVANGHPHRGSP